MGSCLSRKNAKQNEPSLPVEDCRDPPPTESPQEEKVKEVLFLTQTPKLTPNLNTNSNGEATTALLLPAKAKAGGGGGGEVKKMEAEDTLMRTKITRDLERSEDTSATVSERSFSAASTAFTKPEEEIEIEDEEEEEVVMQMNVMKKQQQPQRSVTRSTSPAAKVQKKKMTTSSSGRSLEPRSAAQQQHTKRVDVGCRSARSSSSPSSPAKNRVFNNSNGSRKDSAERTRRSGSPAEAMMMKKRAAAEPAPAPAPRSTMVNGRFQQRIPRVAEEEEEEEVRKGEDEDGIYNPTGRRVVIAGESTGRSDGGNESSEAKESLENPLVSLECFIFL